MKKILLSITTLTLSLFLVTNALAGPGSVGGPGGVGDFDFKWYKGKEGKDMAATVAPKSKKIAHSEDKTKTPDAVDSADHNANKGTDSADTAAPKSKKIYHSKAKSENK